MKKDLLNLETSSYEQFQKSTSKSFDLSYDVMVMYQPGSLTIGYGSYFTPEGKPYPIWISYFVVGEMLLITSERHPTNEFDSKMMIDLKTVDYMSEPCISEESWFLWRRSSLIGEQFYYDDGNREHPFSKKAFCLQYPKSKHFYKCKDAIEFSSALKRRIKRFKKDL